MIYCGCKIGMLLWIKKIALIDNFFSSVFHLYEDEKQEMTDVLARWERVLGLTRVGAIRLEFPLQNGDLLEGFYALVLKLLPTQPLARTSITQELIAMTPKISHIVWGSFTPSAGQ